jgi:magnesium transporter
MISVDTCREKKVHNNGSPAQIKEIINAGKDTVWVDVEAPVEEDWNLLAEQFNFHPLAMEDARKQNQRAKVDQYDGYLFLSLRTWVGFQSPTDDIPEVTDEIDVFLGANYLVTIHQKPCGPVAKTRRRWKEHPDLISAQPAFLLYELLDTIVDDFFPAIDDLDTEIDTLETAIYTSASHADIAPALHMKKKLLLLRQSIAPMRDLLNELLRTDQALIPVETRIYLQDVYDHALRQVEQVDLHRDILSGVLDAMVAQTSNRLNQVMKTMTGISTILMSAALITGVYGMNFENMPELKTKYGYYGALTAMAVVATVLAWFFKRIKWF